MTLPAHGHPENASIRELNTVKDELLKAMEAMEERLTRKIDDGFHRHDGEHREQTRVANERHSAIDTFLDGLRDREQVAVGESVFLSNAMGVLRGVNEFRWLIAAAAAFIALAAGDIHVSFGP